jgi:hypothetical protein
MKHFYILSCLQFIFCSRSPNNLRRRSIFAGNFLHFFVNVIQFTLCVVVLCLIAGCGVRGIPVTGTVTFEDGSPLTHGSVSLSTDSQTFTVPIGTDGKFSMGQTEAGQGIPSGLYKISVSSSPAYGEKETIIPESADPNTFEVKKGNNTPLNIKVNKVQ